MNTSVLAKYKRLASSGVPDARDRDILPLVYKFTSLTSQYINWIHSPEEKFEGCVDFFNGCIISLDNIQEAKGNTFPLAVTFKSHHPKFLTALASWVSKISPSDPSPPPCNCDHTNTLVQLCHTNSYIDTSGPCRPTTSVILSKALLWLGLCFNHEKAYRSTSWPRAPHNVIPFGHAKFLKHVEAWLPVLPCEDVAVLLSVLRGVEKFEPALVRDIHASEAIGPLLLNAGQEIVRKYSVLRRPSVVGQLALHHLHYMLQQFDVTTDAFANIFTLLTRKADDLQLKKLMNGVNNTRAMFELCRNLFELTWMVVRFSPSGADSKLINGAHSAFLYLTLYFSPNYLLPSFTLPSDIAASPHPLQLARTARSRLASNISDEVVWHYLLGCLQSFSISRHCSALDCPNSQPQRHSSKCSSCHLFTYCDRSCQRPDWDRHKKACKVLTALVNQAQIEGLLEIPLVDESVDVFRARCENAGFRAAMAKQLMVML